MARYLLHVYSSPVAGKEAIYHDWYDNTHLRDILSLNGFTAAERLQPMPLATGDAPHGFLAVYEIESDDPAGVMASLNAAGTSGMEISPALDFTSVRMELFRQITPRLESSLA